MKERGSAVQNAASSVNSLSKKVIFLAAAVLIFYIFIKLSFSFGRSLFYVDPADAPPGMDAEIVISADDDAGSVGEKLFEKGVITNALSFKVQGTLYKTDFYPGTYTVNSSMTIKEILIAIDEEADKLMELGSSGSGNTDIKESDAGDDSGVDSRSAVYEEDASDISAGEHDLSTDEREVYDIDAAGSGESIVEIGGGFEGE